MNLTENPELVNWPLTHFVCVEKVGPFQETAQLAWQTLHQNTQDISKQCKITGFMSLYKIEPQMIYCAGVAVDKKPDILATGLKYIKFEGGKYSKFVLTGSYSNLPEACGRVFEIVEATKIQLENNYFIEHYVNNPETTPAEQLITEILIPTV